MVFTGFIPHKLASNYPVGCDTQTVGEVVEPHDLRWYVLTLIRGLSRTAPACILESISNLRTNIAVVACKDCSAHVERALTKDTMRPSTTGRVFMDYVVLYIFLAGVIVGLLAGTSYAGENTREMECVGRGYGSVIVCLCSFLPPNRDQERLFFLRDDLQCQ
jgi:hypothetical protein